MMTLQVVKKCEPVKMKRRRHGGGSRSRNDFFASLSALLIFVSPVAFLLLACEEASCFPLSSKNANSIDHNKVRIETPSFPSYRLSDRRLSSWGRTMVQSRRTTAAKSPTTMMRSAKKDGGGAADASSSSGSSSNYYYGKNMDDGYIPDGLSPEEYQKIKDDEAAKLSRMDFGAFGPRFKRSGRPSDDWMVMPKLWTSGFSVASPSGGSGGTETDSSAKSRMKTLLLQSGAFARTCCPPFMLALICLDCATSALALIRVSKKVVSLGTVLMSALLRRKVLTFAAWKVVLLEVVLAVGLTRPTKQYLEYASRRRLWTQRKTWLATAGAVLCSMTFWAAISSGLRRIALKL